jgi:two-component system, cell cycle response regulator
MTNTLVEYASRLGPALGKNHSLPKSQGCVPTNEAGPRILVIDDSPVSRKLVELALSLRGYELLFAETGHQGLEMFREHKPSLVIMNWTLPDVAGEELCQTIRSMAEEFQTYLIVLTGRTDKECLIRALQAGANDHLTKPFHEEELIARAGAGLRLAELCRGIAKKSLLLEELALTDALTGLPNRRAIENWAQSQLSSASRHGFSYWVVLADLDHFKQVNDSFGHEAGDAVLKKFSKILKSQLRNEDICGRFGGEEFLIVMTHVSKEDALKAIERIRLALQMSPVQFREATVAVTASFGVAGFEQNQVPPALDNLRSLADGALYSAKRRGRNRVEIATAVC